MKIALPVALVIVGVMLIALLMSHRHWEVRTSGDSQADSDKIEQSKQQWLEKNPGMKAEDLAFNQEYQEAETNVRQASTATGEARRKLDDHDSKIREALINSDPSLEPIYQRLDKDRRVHLDSGDQQLFSEYWQGLRPFGPFFLLFFLALPWITAGLGIILLVRPPSLAGAHLFLVFILLPLVCQGPLIQNSAIQLYLTRFDGITDYGPMAETLLSFHKDLAQRYLSFLPALLLYLLLIFRIHFRERKASVKI